MAIIHTVSFTIEDKQGMIECLASIPSLPAALHMQMIDAYILTVTSLLENAAADGNDVSLILPKMRELSKLSGEMISRQYIIGGNTPDARISPKPEPATPTVPAQTGLSMFAKWFRK